MLVNKLSLNFSWSKSLFFIGGLACILIVDGWWLGAIGVFSVLSEDWTDAVCRDLLACAVWLVVNGCVGSDVWVEDRWEGSLIVCCSTITRLLWLSQLCRDAWQLTQISKGYLLGCCFFLSMWSVCGVLRNKEGQALLCNCGDDSVLLWRGSRDSSVLLCGERSNLELFCSSSVLFLEDMCWCGTEEIILCCCGTAEIIAE